MRLSRTDLLPVLTIVAGGVIGASLSFGFLALSRSDDVSAPVRPVPVRSPDGQSRVFDECADDPVYRFLRSVDMVADGQSIIVVECADGFDREADLSAAPVFTPMTVRPEIRNRNEVMQALMREYPPLLRDAGIGGQVVVWFYISETGQVLDRRVSQSSGHEQLDEAALKVADVLRFTPALNRDERVQVWIELPITFQVQ